MNIFKRFLERKHKKDKIKAYYKGCGDANNVRDKKEATQKKIFKDEIQKRDKKIESLKRLLQKNDDKNIELARDLLKLKEQLLLIENFVETKQLDANKDALRKLSTIENTEKIIYRLERKLPEAKRESEKSVIESKIGE